MFKVIAIVILLSFYASYFYKMMIQEKKGIKTMQMGANVSGREKVIEIFLKLFTTLMPFIELASILLVKNVTLNLLYVIGAIFGFLGVCFFIAATYYLGDSWRAGIPEDEKTELVTRGIYKISRNPAFVGFDLVYIGILMMVFNYYLLIATIIAIVVFHFQIVIVEEKFLKETFKDEYQAYAKKVRRYL